jgi:hypothetical protein
MHLLYCCDEDKIHAHSLEKLGPNVKKYTTRMEPREAANVLMLKNTGEPWRRMRNRNKKKRGQKLRRSTRSALNMRTCIDVCINCLYF